VERRAFKLVLESRKRVINFWGQNTKCDKFNKLPIIWERRMNDQLSMALFKWQKHYPVDYKLTGAKTLKNRSEKSCLEQGSQACDFFQKLQVFWAILYMKEVSE
jgi:hypothetical protein